MTTVVLSLPVNNASSCASICDPEFMLSDLLSRIGGGLRLAPPVSPLLSMDGTTTRKPNPCIFCNVSAENGFKITYEARCIYDLTYLRLKFYLQDESFVAFEDLKPAGTVHYLLIPKKHIRSSFYLHHQSSFFYNSLAASVRTLSAEDVKLGKRHHKIYSNLFQFLTVKTMERIGHTVLDSFGVPSDSRR